MDWLSSWNLFMVAFMPILQVLIISGLGASMATQYLDLLPGPARNSLNKIVFTIFAPSLSFASLARTVNFQDIISWWFMPINVGLTFLFGAILGMLLGKCLGLGPKEHIRGLVIASCSAGNLGNLVLIMIPAICQQEGSPFGDHSTCTSVGLSYTAFSMALGGLYMWTFTYQLVRNASMEYTKSLEAKDGVRAPNSDEESSQTTRLLNHENGDEQSIQGALLNGTHEQQTKTFCDQITGFINELKAPPTVGAMLGLFFGAVPCLHHLIIGDHAPLHVVQDCVKLVGDGTIPCMTLILGGNLTEGLRSGRLEKRVIFGVVLVKYICLPLIGMLVVWLAGKLGCLPADPLYHFILMVQFTLPPAMSIGTMTQLFDVGKEECSVLFLWTYAVAAFAVTIWCTIYMLILS